MASLFDLLHGLTKVEVLGPDGTPHFYNPPETDSGKAPGKNALAFLGGVQKQNAQAVEPSTDTHDIQLPTEGSAPIPPELQAIFSGQPQAQGTPGSESVSQQDNQHPLSFLRPNFQQASSDAVGLPSAKSPALTTKGKTLLTLLRGGLGALAGSDQRTAAGGYRAAVEEPVQRVAQRQALERGGLENQVLAEQVQTNPILRILGIQKAQADVSKTTAEANAIPVKAELQRIQALTEKYKEQNGILYDVTTGKPLAPDAAGLVETPADIASALHVKPGTMLPAKHIIDARNAAYGHLAGTDPVVVAQIGQPPVGNPVALAAWGKKAEAIKTRMSAAPRLEMTLARPVQVADPNNPGDTVYVSAGQAIKQGAAGSQSASVQVPKAVLKWATSGNGGEEINAFNTALQHADLLAKAITALGNGDNRTLNSLKNSFKKEFGFSDVTNFQAIANAYGRELTKMLSHGHITNSEIETNEATLPANASPQQLLDVLRNYKALAASKMQMRYEQFQKGMQGKPNFPDSTTSPQNGWGTKFGGIQHQ